MSAARTRSVPDLDAFFRPRAVAVVGASATPGKIGHTILENLLRFGYPGRVYPVNPGRREILGLECFPDVEAAQADAGERGVAIDLAVLAVPVARALEAAEDCGRAGVPFLVVITAGFKEVGAEGLRRERELMAILRRHGVRAMGPNCLGMVDTHTPINTLFVPNMPRRGPIAFISQSGALQAAILDWSLTQGFGFSKFVSLGNKADLVEVDFIAHAARDGDSRVILAYLEDVTDGRRFVEVVREASLRTPVVILKSGRSEAGARAASSHTGALAGTDRAYEAAFRQAGALRVDTMEELFDVAVALADLPPPAGRRVAVVTNSGGPGILTTDAIERHGLVMARFTPETAAHLRRHLPPEAPVHNPVDVLGDGSPDRFEVALKAVARDPGVDACLVLQTATPSCPPEALARLLIRVRREQPGLPLMAVFLGGPSVEGARAALNDAGVPHYFAPERAVRALAGMVRVKERAEAVRRGLDRGKGAGGEPGEAPAAGEDAGAGLDGRRRERVARVLELARAEGRRVLLGVEANQVLEAYGIPVAPSRLVQDADEAVRAAESLGYPVALKVASPRIMHKTDVGGVRLNLASAEDVRAAVSEMLHAVHHYLPGVPLYGLEVQQMARRGREVICGLSDDVQFGHLLMFGLGGIYVHLFEDVSFRLTVGLDREEIKEMVAETRAHRLLRGLRGEPPADLEAVYDVLERLARLAEEVPAVAELDINPLFVYEQGACAVDVKLTVTETGAGLPRLPDGEERAPAREGAGRPEAEVAARPGHKD